MPQTNATNCLTEWITTCLKLDIWKKNQHLNSIPNIMRFFVYKNGNCYIRLHLLLWCKIKKMSLLLTSNTRICLQTNPVGREESRVRRGQGGLHSLLNLAQMLQLVNITIWAADMPKWCSKNFLQKHAIWTLASGNMLMHFLHYNMHTVFPSMKLCRILIKQFFTVPMSGVIITFLNKLSSISTFKEKSK